MKNKNVCIVCGFNELVMEQYANIPDHPHPITILPPFETVWGMPSFEECRNCHFEPGSDDIVNGGNPNFLREHLVNWYLNVYRGFPKEDWPWDPELIEQLKAAGIPVPPEIGPS